eukprot:UN14720
MGICILSLKSTVFYHLKVCLSLFKENLEFEKMKVFKFLADFELVSGAVFIIIFTKIELP